jgi:glucuronate isomerase
MAELADFLNALHTRHALPKTILYSLNPNDNKIINTMLNAFNEAPTVAKIQQGSAWWFNDSKHGMEEQLQCVAESSNLSGFVGMLTDSRSFTSYTRHPKELFQFLAHSKQNMFQVGMAICLKRAQDGSMSEHRHLHII